MGLHAQERREEGKEVKKKEIGRQKKDKASNQEKKNLNPRKYETPNILLYTEKHINNGFILKDFK